MSQFMKFWYLSRDVIVPQKRGFDDLMILVNPRRKWGGGGWGN